MTPNERVLSFQVPDVCAKFGVKWGIPLLDYDAEQKGSFFSGSGRLCQISLRSVKNFDRESRDRQTDRQTDTTNRTPLVTTR